MSGGISGSAGLQAGSGVLERPGDVAWKFRVYPMPAWRPALPAVVLPAVVLPNNSTDFFDFLALQSYTASTLRVLA